MPLEYDVFATKASPAKYLASEDFELFEEYI
jgi:hypothetical protein